MRRKPILALYRAERHKPFAWGERDCLTWCGDCARALTGRDPAERLRGRYTTAVGARRVMAREGWSDMADVARSLLPEIPVAQARTGDWAWFENDDGTDGLGVVVRHQVVARGKTALSAIPLTRARAAFRLG